MHSYRAGEVVISGFTGDSITEVPDEIIDLQHDRAALLLRDHRTIVEIERWDNKSPISMGDELHVTPRIITAFFLFKDLHIDDDSLVGKVKTHFPELRRDEIIGKKDRLLSIRQIPLWLLHFWLRSARIEPFGIGLQRLGYLIKLSPDPEISLGPFRDTEYLSSFSTTWFKLCILPRIERNPIVHEYCETQLDPVSQEITAMRLSDMGMIQYLMNGLTTSLPHINRHTLTS